MYYSQENQDKFLNEEIFKNYKWGIFVDVGAHDGKTFNNTLYFEINNKWNGINIEPIEKVYKTLTKNRPNCININCAVSNYDGISEFIEIEGYSEMISGLKDTYDDRHNKRLSNEISKFGGNKKIINVETKKLSTIFKDNNIKYINYLSIDVEGAEFEVIKSIDFNDVFIDVINFENNYPDKSSDIIKYLESKSYVVINNPSITVDIFMIHKYSKFYNNYLKFFSLNNIKTNV